MTIILEVLLAVIGLTGGILCLAVSVFFCKIACSINYATSVRVCPVSLKQSATKLKPKKVRGATNRTENEKKNYQCIFQF